MTDKREIKIKLSVIVPTYNDSESLKHSTESLCHYLDTIVGVNQWQYVIVSNGCTDDTEEIVKEIVNYWPQTHYLCLNKPDYGNALKEGLRKSDGEWAYIINVDHWDPMFLFWAWQHRNNYDIFIGSKRGDPSLDFRPKFRKILTWGLNVVLQIFFGLVVTDSHGQKLLNIKTMNQQLISGTRSFFRGFRLKTPTSSR